MTIEWTIGELLITGSGTLDGKVLVVDWGAEFPVVYAAMDGRELRGYLGWWAGRRQNDAKIGGSGYHHER